ncbi:MAG: hypothetical protein AAGC63_16055, partial [Propionicimonas sp.]
MTDPTPSRGLRIYLGVLVLVLVLAEVGFGALALGGLRGDVPMVVASLLVAAGWLGLAAWGMVALGRSWPVQRAEEAGALLRSTQWWLTTTAWWAPAVGLLLAFVAFIDCGPVWIPNLFHWYGLVMTVLVLAALYSLPGIARALSDGPHPAAPSRPWW